MKRYKNIRISEEVHTELFKLKSLAALYHGRVVSYDDLLRDMIGLYQSVINGMKIKKRIDKK